MLAQVCETTQSRWFAEEIQPHEEVLRGYLYRLVGLNDVDDLIQETYLRLLQAHARGGIRSARGLLFATARNAARDLFRRRATAKTDTVAETEWSHVLDEAPGVSESVGRKQEIEFLEAAINSLPDRCRTVLILKKFEHLSQKEIAARMGTAEHTVEAQLTKALRLCEEYFVKHGLLPK